MGRFYEMEVRFALESVSLKIENPTLVVKGEEELLKLLFGTEPPQGCIMLALEALACMLVGREDDDVGSDSEAEEAEEAEQECETADGPDQSSVPARQEVGYVDSSDFRLLLKRLSDDELRCMYGEGELSDEARLLIADMFMTRSK